MPLPKTRTAVHWETGKGTVVACSCGNNINVIKSYLNFLILARSF